MVQMLSQEVSYNHSMPYLDTPLDPSLFPLTAGVRMARTDMVAARIWYQRPAAITVCCMGSCSWKEVACRSSY